MRTLGILLLLLGVLAIAGGRFSVLVPPSFTWIGLAVIVLAWIVIGLSFRARAPSFEEPSKV